MEENYIESEIKKRKIIYYPISDGDLEILKSKSIWSDVFMILTSLSLSVFSSSILTKYMSIGKSLDFQNILIILSIFSGILFLVFLIFTIIFNISSRKHINNIKSKDPERLEVSEFAKHPNPEYYIGDQRIIMNINIHKKESFLRLFHSEKKYNQLKTNSHKNTVKKDYFTFIIENGSRKLYVDFQKFLTDNKIDFIDYK